MPTRPLNVLVVEDHRDTGIVIGMFLEVLGHMSLVAFDARSALMKARDSQFDVLLTDIGLPDLNGWEMLAVMESLGKLPCRVVTMSAGNNDEFTKRSQAAGAQAHLEKPFLLETLRDAIQG